MVYNKAMDSYTPMMQQYLAIKENHPDALLFYRLGDFYEMFFEDAKIGARELDLVLTGRNGGQPERIPMCGVPYHALNSYLQRLVSRGYKVAIVEQLEDPATTKGMVKRDVIRVVTPGTLSSDLTDERENVFLGAAFECQSGIALAFCDLSSGDCGLKLVAKSGSALLQELLKQSVKELVVSESFPGKYLAIIRENGSIALSYLENAAIPQEYADLAKDISEPYNQQAFGLLVNYLMATQRQFLAHLLPPESQDEKRILQLDYATITNLELTKPLRPTGKNDCLWSFLDHSQSAMGSRLLKKWIEKPLRDLKEIQDRQDTIAFLLASQVRKDDLKLALRQIYDLERLTTRFALSSANGQDCIRLTKTLQQVPIIQKLMNGAAGRYSLMDVDGCQDLLAELDGCFVEDPPVNPKDGGIFADGYHKELDELRQLQKDDQKWILDLEARMREETGIKNLKVGYNRVFGYYFEVSKANIPMLQGRDYIRKQTLANGERFVTPELKEKEESILHAKEKSIRLENQLFSELLDKVRGYLGRLQKLAQALAAIDALYSLSTVSEAKGYHKPSFNSEGRLEIIDGRHPVLETLRKQHYIPNSLQIEGQKRLCIITGPNMGGKSTFMRQVALIVILAQIGCYVPAKSCDTILFDRCFTRIGASDDILSGQSTFMVEMLEANQALQYATKDSLILFDEIGRGTSTYDGMALAQAILEYIGSAIQAITLFSTHYHELTALSDSLPCVFNVHASVKEDKENVEFLYKIKPGKADRSYGVHVARLAKIPEAVIERAKTLQKELESKKRVVQSSLQIIEAIPAKEKRILNTLSQADADAMSPRDALQFLYDLKKEMEK
jgi:DNA mismatch repair protein MutS